ncbi:Ribosomal protein S6 kinase beta-2 [Coemansia sp. RSA 2704]|nr:Ribosomal protein S6 kinase beta-2 [Coemansia sp. RSA 2704]
MAPKVLKSSGSYDLSVNWWSLAILLYVMPTGSVSLKGKVPDQIAKNISKMKVNYPNYLTPNTKDLIIHLLCKKPAQCIGYGSHGMANIQKHQLLASIKGHSRLADLNVHLDSAIAPAANTTADIDPATMFLGFSYITTLVIDTNN